MLRTHKNFILSFFTASIGEFVFMEELLPNDIPCKTHEPYIISKYHMQRYKRNGILYYSHEQLDAIYIAARLMACLERDQKFKNLHFPAEKSRFWVPTLCVKTQLLSKSADSTSECTDFSELDREENSDILKGFLRNIVKLEREKNLKNDN